MPQEPCGVLMKHSLLLRIKPRKSLNVLIVVREKISTLNNYRQDFFYLKYTLEKSFHYFGLRIMNIP